MPSNIKALDHRFQLTGRAYTVLYGPAGNPPGTVGDYIDEVEPGRVIVLDNGGRENATVWAISSPGWPATSRSPAR